MYLFVRDANTGGKMQERKSDTFLLWAKIDRLDLQEAMQQRQQEVRPNEYAEIDTDKKKKNELSSSVAKTKTRKRAELVVRRVPFLVCTD